jgi:tetratricopeptide (TPR) repeat protein
MIYLTLLCRDEAERLPALAERLDPLELGGVIVMYDDRTVDDTFDVAERLWPTAVIEPVTFEDFSQARNALLDFARCHVRPDDYLLMLDPDSLPDGTLPPDEELTADAYTCEWRWAGEAWPRIILLRAGATAAWREPVHEYLDAAGLVVDLPGVWVDAVVTASAERLAWIEDVLRRDAAANPRSAFYLAQTLADLGRRDEALCWYLRRAAMGHGWAEETYLATYTAGVLMESFDWHFATTLWQRCIEMRPGRVEPWWQLARAANQRGDHSEALSHASAALRLPPSTDTLRVNRWIETVGAAEQFDQAATGLLTSQTSRMEHAHG